MHCKDTILRTQNNWPYSKLIPNSGKEGNTYPVVIGGGYKLDEATVMVLRKKAGRMSLTVLNAQGEELLKLDL